MSTRIAAIGALIYWLVLFAINPLAFAAPLATQIPFSAVPASATKITFETTPQGANIPFGTPAANIWASIGVKFDSNDTVGTGGDFTITSPPNTLSGDNTVSFASIHAMFNPPVSLAGAWGFDFVMEAFDSGGTSIGAITYTDGSPGLNGGANEYGFLGLTSTTPIASVEFRRAFPNQQSFGYHIDDLTFVQVPEPSTLALAALGALGLLLAARRKR